MAEQVLVVGLGFGTAVARELESLGHEVLGVDADEGTVNEIAPELTHALQLDASDEAALRAVGAEEFALAVVAPRRHGVRPFLLRRGDEVIVAPEPSERLATGGEIVVGGPDRQLAKLRG